MSEELTNKTSSTPKRKLTREEWEEFMRSMAGSITDETFRAPRELSLAYEYGDDVI